MIDQITSPQVIEAYKRKNYKLFTNQTRDYNFNLFAVRNSDMTPGILNDVFGLLWKYQDRWNLRLFHGTTESGLYYLKNPMNRKGTAILKPDQYIKGYKLCGPGWPSQNPHGCKGHGSRRYEALRQDKPFVYYRDNNRDSRFDLDPDTLEYSLAHTNLHRTSWSKKLLLKLGVDNIGRDSAGCQVIWAKEWNDFLGLIQQSAKIYGDYFTYTLFVEYDILC